MKKLFLIILCISITSIINAQNQFYSYRTLSSFLNGIELVDDFAFHVKFSDATTVVMIKKVNIKGMIKLKMFITTINPIDKKFETKIMGMDNQETLRNENYVFFKINNELVRIRTEKEGKEYHYFIDQLNNDDFLKSDQPFFKGLIEDGFSVSMFRVKSFKDFFRIEWFMTGNNSFKTESQTTIKYHYFKNEGYHFLKELKVEIPKNHGMTEHMLLRRYTISDERELFYYQYFDKVLAQSKIKLIMVDYLDIQNIKCNYEIPEISFEKDEIIKDIFFYKSKNNEYIHVYSSKNKSWYNTLYSLEPVNSEIIQISRTEINRSIFGTEKEFIDLNKPNCYLAPYLSLNDQGDIYLLSGFSDLIYRPDGLNCSNLLITKISNDKIEWNQYIHKVIWFDHIDSYSISITDMDIVIDDQEPKQCFDKDGKYLEEKTQPAVIKMANTVLTINKQTGKFKRELKNK